MKIAWNLSRVINNLEHEIDTGYVHDPATKDFSLGSHDIINVNLGKTEDVETARNFSINDALDKLDTFDHQLQMLRP